MTPGSGNLVYVGAYTAPRGRAEGIYTYRLASADGALEPVAVLTGVASPSFLTMDAQKRHLYAVNELGMVDGKPAGGASALAIDAKTGTLTLLNQQPTHGTSPCHLILDPSGRWLLVANYSSGNVTVFPVLANGHLGAASHVVQHQGSGPNKRRQEGPHAHSVNLDPTGKLFLVADLGLDKVMAYKLDATTGKLVAHDPPWAATPPGAGPRHMAFHPNGRFLYVANEIDSTVSLFTYDAARGALQLQQTLATLPAGFTGDSTCADIHLTPSGGFVYVSNRGHDSLAIFAIDARSGRMTAAGHASTGGATPRNFAIAAGGDLLLAANQNGDNIVAFHIDAKSGALTPTGAVTKVPSPVCILIV